MRLNLGTFPVEDVVFGAETKYREGLLTVNREEMLALIRQDARITAADLEIVRPGDSVRITSVRDMVEPRVKVEGPGQAYPGFCGRSVETVGNGKTHRLAGIAVLEVADVPRYSGEIGGLIGFLDMAEPGRHASPIGSLRNLCVVLDVDRTIAVDSQNDAVHGAALTVQDRLAATTIGMEPREREVFELGPVDPSLPRIAYIMGLNSPQHYANSLTAYGTGIYGLTRQTPPWYLHPNELLDGAISFRGSWMHVNNPVVLGLMRRHGKDVAFVGVIAIRTRWSAQAEKDITANQAAKLAKVLGVQGAIVAYDAYGNDFMEVIQTVQACEREGVKTVFMTAEEPSHTGSSLLQPVPEANAIVSVGIGIGLVVHPPQEDAPPAARPVPAVARVIGVQEIQADPGKGVGMVSAMGPFPRPRSHDAWGFNRLSAFTY